jgi:hypothetical protein
MSITAKSKNGTKTVKTTKKTTKVIAKKPKKVNRVAKKAVKKNGTPKKVLKANGNKKETKNDHHQHIMPAHVIVKKRRGEVLSEAEIKFFIDGLAKGTLPEY